VAIDFLRGPLITAPAPTPSPWYTRGDGSRPPQYLRTGEPSASQERLGGSGAFDVAGSLRAAACSDEPEVSKTAGPRGRPGRLGPRPCRRHLRLRRGAPGGGGVLVRRRAGPPGGRPHL